jgi:hypothetical protein
MLPTAVWRLQIDYDVVSAPLPRVCPGEAPLLFVLGGGGGSFGGVIPVFPGAAAALAAEPPPPGAEPRGGWCPAGVSPAMVLLKCRAARAAWSDAAWRQAAARSPARLAAISWGGHAKRQSSAPKEPSHRSRRPASRSVRRPAKFPPPLPSPPLAPKAPLPPSPPSSPCKHRLH